MCSKFYIGIIIINLEFVMSGASMNQYVMRYVLALLYTEHNYKIIGTTKKKMLNFRSLAESF